MDFADEDEGEFSQNTDYCTVHGDPVTVLTDDTGEIYVNYRDVKKAGFALFRRDNFDALLMDRKQISKEFELFLLAEARTYILKKQVKFSEEEILSTIERCREKVMSGQSKAQTTTSDRRSVNAAGPCMTVTNGNVSGFGGPRDEFKRPRPPHTNFQSNNSFTNERSDRKDQSVGGDSRGSDRRRDSVGRGGSSRGRNKSSGPQRRYTGSENTNAFANNASNDNDFERNSSNVQEFTRSKPSGQDFGNNKPNNSFGRNNQTGGASRRNTGTEDIQSNRNSNDSQSNRGSQPKRQHTNSNSAVSGDDCSSVRSDRYAKNHGTEELKSVTLQPGNTYDVIVSYVDNEKVQWIQTKEYHDKVIDMTVELVDAAPSLEDITNPNLGQLVLAEHDEVWFRARVIKQEPLLVHYLDYGNKNKPSSMKVLPEEYKKMPATALRTTGLQNLNMNIQEEQQLRLNIKQQYDDGTYLVKLNDTGSTSGTKSHDTYNAAETHSTPQEDLRKNTPAKSMERRPASRTEVQEEVYIASNLSPLFKLRNDEPIKIVGRRDFQLLIKNKECYEKSKELNEYIKKLDKSGLVLGSVKVGQLVLAKKDDGVDNDIWQRATVVSKEGAACIQISYIDFPGEDTLAVKSLRNVDEHLANYPALMTMSPIFTALQSGTSSALEYVDQLIQDKAKLRLVIEGDDVDFKFEDGSLLSKKISNISKGPSVEPPELVPAIEKAAKQEPAKQEPAKTEKPTAVSSSVNTPKPATEPITTPKPLNEKKAESSEPFTLDYMDWTRLSVGTHDVLFYTINDATEITVVSMDEKLLDQLALVSVIQVNDNTPYAPVEGEMCLQAGIEPI
ncbi:unnamed protein product [Callosobruchus maculatus]|nr:unnamed protein product [Callosobruchus maculatus]